MRSRLSGVSSVEIGLPKTSVQRAVRSAWPQALVEVSSPPLSFARAVNRGIARARYSHVCLLNNDMILVQREHIHADRLRRK